MEMWRKSFQGKRATSTKALVCVRSCEGADVEAARKEWEGVRGQIMEDLVDHAVNTGY